MNNEFILAFISRLPEYVLGIVNVIFIIQLRRLMLTSESVKTKDERIASLVDQLENARYNADLMQKHYNQLIQSYKSKEGELLAYQKIGGEV